MTRIVVDPHLPAADAIAQAAALIQRGGTVVIPTDTFYGVAADPRNAQAVRRIFSAKGRPDGRPLLLVAADLEQVERVVGAVSAGARRLAQSFWPGPLTMLFRAPSGLAEAVTAGSGRVGIRVPAHAATRAVCAAAGFAVTATSANLSGEPATGDPAALSASLLAEVDALLDGGATPGGGASTIVDVVDTAPRLIRDGVIPWPQVEACWNRA